MYPCWLWVACYATIKLVLTMTYYGNQTPHPPTYRVSLRLLRPKVTAQLGEELGRQHRVKGLRQHAIALTATVGESYPAQSRTLPASSYTGTGLFPATAHRSGCRRKAESKRWQGGSNNAASQVGWGPSVARHEAFGAHTAWLGRTAGCRRPHVQASSAVECSVRASE